MPDIQAKIDADYEATGLAVTDDSNTFTEPIRVNASSKRLEVEFTVDNSLPSTSDPTVQIDANREVVGMVVTDNNAETVVPLPMTSTGLLICDVTIE